MNFFKYIKLCVLLHNNFQCYYQTLRKLIKLILQLVDIYDLCDRESLIDQYYKLENENENQENQK
eukprot:UN08049